jgi:SET domain-containing protein
MGREPKTRQNLPHYGVYTRLRPSSIHGIGVFAIQEIKKGTYVFPGDDYPVVWVKKEDLIDIPKQIQQLYEDFAVVKDNGSLFGCPKNFNVLTVGWYMNHSDNPNVECDIEHDYDFFAIRDIHIDEELTIDYSTLTDQPLKFN